MFQNFSTNLNEKDKKIKGIFIKKLFAKTNSQ